MKKLLSLLVAVGLLATSGCIARVYGPVVPVRRGEMRQHDNGRHEGREREHERERHDD